MSRLITVFLVMMGLIYGSDAWCSPGRSGGTMMVCKNEGKSNCIAVNSPDSCINLTGGPFKSGYTNGNYRCTLYSVGGCAGTQWTADKAGYSRFSTLPNSVRCPCV